MGAGSDAGDGGRCVVASGRVRGDGGSMAAGQRAVLCDGGLAPRPCADSHGAERSRRVVGAAASASAAECFGHSGWSGGEAAAGGCRLARRRWGGAPSPGQRPSGSGGCERGRRLPSATCGCRGRGSGQEAQARVLRGCRRSGRSAGVRDLGGGIGGDCGVLGGGASGLRDAPGGRRVCGSGGSAVPCPWDVLRQTALTGRTARSARSYPGRCRLPGQLRRAAGDADRSSVGGTSGRGADRWGRRYGWILRGAGADDALRPASYSDGTGAQPPQGSFRHGNASDMRSCGVLGAGSRGWGACSAGAGGTPSGRVCSREAGGAGCAGVHPRGPHGRRQSRGAWRGRGAGCGGRCGMAAGAAPCRGLPLGCAGERDGGPWSGGKGRSAAGGLGSRLEGGLAAPKERDWGCPEPRGFVRRRSICGRRRRGA